MKIIKNYILIYIYFVYETYLEQDWEDFNLLGKIIIKPFWYLKWLYIITYSVFCFPIVLFHIYTKTNKKWISFWSDFNKFVREEFFKMGWLK